MTEQELKIYRLDTRLMLLERAYSSVLIGLLVRAGATIEQSRAELVFALEREGKQIQGELLRNAPKDPAKNALMQDEFREIVEELKALINSYS